MQIVLKCEPLRRLYECFFLQSEGEKNTIWTITPITVTVTTGKIGLIGPAGDWSVLRALRWSGIPRQKLSTMTSAAAAADCTYLEQHSV